MQSVQPAQTAKESSKAPTGIRGFDEITRGGLPRAHSTLVVGSPGSGTYMMALKSLPYGARDCKEPGTFVASEDTSQRIEANAESVGWGLAEFPRKKNLFLLDAQPKSDPMPSGDFGLGAMQLEQLKGKAKHQWGKLSEDDFDVIDGKRDKLSGPIQEHKVSPAMGRRNRLQYAVRLFVIALIAAIFGVVSPVPAAAGIGQMLFVVFLVLAIMSFLIELSRRQ